MEVTSEILPSFQTDFQSKPSINSKYVVSKFSFTCPSSVESSNLLEKDDDGDYVITRKEEVFKEVSILLAFGNTKVTCVIIENDHSTTPKVFAAEACHIPFLISFTYYGHGISTKLELVGLQIWRGALLLADFLIHIKDEIKDKKVLELGAGVGLTSIIAGMYAQQIISTDVDRGDILKLLASNIDRNKDIIKGDVLVKEIDFFNRDWSQEIQDKMKEVSIIISADVIYDNNVTEAFINTLTKILEIPPKKSLYLALEKRYVFTIADLDAVAPCYEYLLSSLDKAKKKEPFSLWKIEQVSLDFPQYLRYERVKELTMFKISVT